MFKWQLPDMSLQDIFHFHSWIQSDLRLHKQCLYRVYSLVYMVQRVANSSGFRPRPAMHDITLKSKGLKYDKETKLKVHF